MKLKKLMAAVIAAAMCLSMMAGCSNKDSDSSDNGSGSGSSQQGGDSNSGGEENNGGYQSPYNGQQEIRDISSAELVKEMSIGWNLGNTMDATGVSGLESETAWQGAKTTKPMMDLLKSSGFNILRVPVTWESHMDSDGNIDKEWMDRVQEIVDYGIDNDLFVILNIHHEEWHFPSYDNLDAAKEKIIKTWSQIADRFKNYDEHLIFEGMNEPRKKGTPVEWTGGDDEGRDVVNQLNMAFVETVRNSGGNNKLRHLMIPTYGASSTPNAMQALQMPENDDKIIVSVHAYVPYDFALNTSGTAKWSIDNPSDTQAIDNVFRDIDNNFLSKGIPVIIGEFGSMNKFDTETETGDNREARVECGKYYMSKAKEYGVPCVWWDNNAFVGNGENFGLMERDIIPGWRFPDIVEAITGQELPE